MNLITDPASISKEHFEQVVELVKVGEQIPENSIRIGLQRSDRISLRFSGGTVVSTATLKNPRQGYKEGVFEDAGVGKYLNQFSYELGYIATHPMHEKKHHCQYLLDEFFPTISTFNLFATTRKEAMIHILEKYGFERHGNTFGNALTLMLYFGHK